MIKKLFTALFAAVVLQATAQDSLNMQRLGYLDYTWKLSGIWGYADTATNKEYALVGVEEGFSVVNVTNPSTPTQEFIIYGAYSLWREIKTWSHYAFVSHDMQYSWSTVPSEGILIVDLDSMQNPHFKRFRPKFTKSNGTQDSLLTAHTVFIDEFGVLYVFGASGYNGSSLFSGGALMFDVATDPWNPIYLGRFENYYLHDGYVRDNVLYGSAIYNGILSIIDVSVKSAPQIVATKQTPNQFTHNAWLSDDDKTIFTTDEVSNGYIAAYDISDLTNISELDKIRMTPVTGTIPHNVHVRNDFLISSYYTNGVQVVDAEHPDLLVEVGNYDTSPLFSGNGFNGAWGVYPYLPSGNIVVSDMEEGLQIVNFNNKKASRLHGLVKDSLSGNSILGANINVAVANVNFTSSITGTFKMGFEAANWDTLTVSKTGYQTRKVAVQFTSGVYDSVTIALLPDGFAVDEMAQNRFELFPNPSKNEFSLKLDQSFFGAKAELVILNALGQIVQKQELFYADEICIKHNLPAGTYVVKLNACNKNYSLKLQVL